MQVNNFWLPLFTAVLHLFAGGLLFIFVTNRLLSRVRGSLGKLLFLLAMLLTFTLGPAVFGWWVAVLKPALGMERWAFPGLILSAWVVGDIRMLWIHRKVRGSAPDHISPPLQTGLDFLLNPVTTQDLKTVSYTISWSGPDLTLLQLSDLHLNHAVPFEYYQQVIDQANQLQPDLVLLSGDFVSQTHEVPLLPGLLSQLKTTSRVKINHALPGKAVVASLGNHDYWSDLPGIQNALQTSNVCLLSHLIQPVEVDGQFFSICSDNRPWGPGVHPPSGKKPVAPILVLSHSPDNIYDLARLPGCTAVFSGHVHAGQFRLPLPWGSTAVLLPSKFGRQLDHGHFGIPSPHNQPGSPVHLFVSAGIGASEPPVRLYCPPEIIVVNFRSKKHAS